MTGRGNFGERQAPRADDGAGDWGFLAHRSIYDFAGRFVRGRRCLEIGCGTGYGSRLLLDAGATSLVAIDKDAAGLDALRARHPAVTFVARDLDLDGLELPVRSVDMVFSSNVFEHLAYPDGVLAGAATALADDGIAIIAVPPITSVGALAENARNIFHINNIPTWAWAAKLGRYFHHVAGYRHWVRPEKLSPSNTIVRDDPRPDDFVFEAVEGHVADSITAIFVAERPRRPPLPQTGAEETCPPEWKAAKVEADARQEMVVRLKREIADVSSWAADNRHHGVDAGFIVDSVCRQLDFLTGRAA